MSRGNMVNNELRRYGAGRNTERIILPCWPAWPTCRRRTRIKPTDAAEQLDVQVMETRKKKLGADHPDALYYSLDTYYYVLFFYTPVLLL